MSKHVLIAGLYHETNTFLEGCSRLEDFSILRGEEIFEAEGDASPLAGCLAAGRAARWKIVPALDMRAMPGPVVEDRAIEFFWGEFESAAYSSAGQAVDGILLVLHGAMVSQSIGDVEGEILSRIRHLYGPQTPVCGVFDLHANFTLRMAQNSDGLIAYREHPHTDARNAAESAALLLDRLMRTGEKTNTVREHPAVMWPPTGTATATEPMRSLEELAREIEQEDEKVLVVNVLAGFAFADVPDAGVSFAVVTLGEPERERRKLRRLAETAIRKRHLGNVLDPPVEEIIGKVSRLREGPIVIAEPSDNIGAGAPGSGTGLLRALLENHIENAIVVINDPEAVQILKNAKNGEVTRLSIGGKGSRFYEPPVEVDAELISTSEGRFELEDPRSHLASLYGKHINMGPCAVIEYRGIRILLTSRKTPPFDLGQLRSQGIEPEKAFVIGVKAAVAHHQAYKPITPALYSVDTAGPCSSNLRSFPYQKVQRPIYPLDE